MECTFCGCEADCTEVYKWEHEEEKEIPDQVCNACSREMHFIERVQGMSEEELTLIRGDSTPVDTYRQERNK
jgi:hypothetical protein